MSLSYQEQTEALKRAEVAILQEISEPMTTELLVRNLMPRLADEYSIKAAIWHLIGRGSLEIRREPDRILLAKV